MLEEFFSKTKDKDVVLIIISSIAIVAFWRGVWNLFDYYLLPGYFLYSQIISIVFGIAILFLLSKIK